SIFALAVAAAALPFTEQGRGLLGAVKRKLDGRIETRNAEDQDGFRQAEARLREQYEADLEVLRDQAKAAEEAARKAAERPTETVLPPIDEHTAQSGGDVRKLRSEITLKTEVEIAPGTLASIERKD